MIKVTWSPRARAELRALTGYLREHGSLTAQTASEDLFTKANQLSSFPEMGRPGVLPGTRERSVPRWHVVIVYRVLSDGIEISTLRDPRREKRTELDV